MRRLDDLRERELRAAVRTDGVSGGDDGVVAIVPTPANPTLAVLVVSGRTPKAVENAAAIEDAVSYGHLE